MVTVERVLPWRRERRNSTEPIGPLVEKLVGPDREEKVDLVSRAYRMADKAHASQFRKSGEPYIVHPLAVAQIVADLGLDEVTIASALLHDVVEDTDTEVEDIRRAFGPEVALIVDGLTKLERLKHYTREQAQADTFRKMILAIAKDTRVLIIKLCDRLHNVRTLAALPPWKQERIARESLDIYAPLAHRMGMEDVKAQLEDLSFAALHPKRYAEIEFMVHERAPEREYYITQVLEEVRDRVKELGIEAEFKGRDKHLYSIYEKMIIKEKEFDEINDLVGIRVIVDGIRDCYAALGSIHATWKPVPGRFKDYVAMPKFNLYQSLHTTVVGPKGKTIEVQIRTHEMHRRAESGVAAHYAYKDGNGDEPLNIPWLSRITDWEKETSDPGEFMKSLKVDLDHEDVYVFTPQGRVVVLPAGACPIDFAYAVHTDLGHGCVGARVDGRLVALSTKLQSGQTIEIFTSKVENAGPSRDWLEIVRSKKAGNKIKQWYSRERRQQAIVDGRRKLSAALKREGWSKADLARAKRTGIVTATGESGSGLEMVAQKLGFVNMEALHEAIGDGTNSAESVAGRIAKVLNDLVRPQSTEPDPAPELELKREVPGSSGVSVEGFEDVFVRLSRCCTPVPPDSIMGFVTRGRGVSVHRTDCSNAESLMSSQRDRSIEVEWNNNGTEGFVATVEVKAYDRAHLLANVSKTFSERHINIVGCSTATASDRIARLTFDFEISEPTHLDWLIRSLRQVDGVYDVYRVLPGKER